MSDEREWLEGTHPMVERERKDEFFADRYDDLAANVAALADEYRKPGACTCEHGSVPNPTGWGSSATTTWHDDCPTHATDYRLRALLGGDTTDRSDG